MLRAPPGLALLLLLMAGLACAATHTTTHILSTNTNHQQSHRQQQQHHHNSNKSFLTTALRIARNANSNLKTGLATSSTRKSALEVLNPWLSACDLQPASATDLSPDTCITAPEAAMWTTTQCPPPCPTVSTITTTASSSRRSGSGSTTTTRTHASASSTPAPNHHNQQQQQQQQCLVYLEDTHKDEVCDLPVGSGSGKASLAEARAKRRAKMAQFRLRHCCEHTVDSALPEVLLYGRGGEDSGSTVSVADDTRMCRQLVGALLEVDALAARVSCEFAEVLARYDCGQRYSIRHQCEDCKEVYRKWVCSSLVPHFTTEGRRIRPCLGVCQLVEERCPYMLPGDRAPAHPTQYAGEPTFLCLDQNIPETGEQRSKSSQGPADCCYNHCGSPGRGDRVVTSRSGNLCVHCPPGPDQLPPVDQLPETVTCPVTVTVNATCDQMQHAKPPPSTSTALASANSTVRMNSCLPLAVLMLWLTVVLLVATDTFSDVLLLLDELRQRLLVLTKCCWPVAQWSRYRHRSEPSPHRCSTTPLALVSVSCVCVLLRRVRRTCDNYYDYHDGVWVSNGHVSLRQCLDLLLLYLLLDFNTNDFLYNWTSCL